MNSQQAGRVNGVFARVARPKACCEVNLNEFRINSAIKLLRVNGVEVRVARLL